MHSSLLGQHELIDELIDGPKSPFRLDGKLDGCRSRSGEREEAA